MGGPFAVLLDPFPALSDQYPLFFYPFPAVSDQASFSKQKYRLPHQLSCENVFFQSHNTVWPIALGSAAFSAILSISGNILPISADFRLQLYVEIYIIFSPEC